MSTSQPFATLPSQSRHPVRQLDTRHTPPTHAGVARGGAHMRPQAPQCGTLVATFTQDPPQSVVPAGQAWPQVPATQVAVPPAGAGQTLPQRPQLRTSTATLTSQPLEAFMSQLAKPAAQVNAQVDAAQAAVMLGGDVHRRPQAPQWFRSPATLTSHPSAAVPLQSRQVPVQAPT